MTDFSNLQTEETEYAFICMTEDRTTAYAMRKTDNYIYRSYDGETWEKLDILIRYTASSVIFPVYGGNAGNDDVIIVDQSTYNTSYAYAYWINSQGFTVQNLSETNVYKGDWQATGGYLYFIETEIKGGRRYFTFIRLDRTGRKETLYTLDVDQQKTSRQFTFFASGENVMLSRIEGDTYFIEGTEIKATFKDKGDVFYFGEISENIYAVLMVTTPSNLSGVRLYTFYKFDASKLEFEEIEGLQWIDNYLYSSTGIYNTRIKNELHDAIYFRFREYNDMGIAGYGLYCLNLKNITLENITYGTRVLLPFDIGAGQLIVVVEQKGDDFIYYTEEGKENWLNKKLQNGDLINALEIMQNGTMLGTEKTYSGSKEIYIGIKAKWNVKDSGVKIFIDGEKKDLRAYNLTNPDAIRQNKIHVINAQGEHVVLYDREVPEPRKKHLVFFDGKQPRYIYSI